MSLRGLWIRLRSLPFGSPLHVALEKAAEDEAESERNEAIDDALNRYR